MSMDIQGYIVEKLTGQSLPDFLRDQVFTPLGMKDAGFYVPADKRARFAAGYHQQNGELVAEPTRMACPRITRRSPRRLPAAAASYPPPKIITASPQCSSMTVNWAVCAFLRLPP